MRDKLIWVGARESDIAQAAQLFDGSVTYYGSGENGNVSFSRQFGKWIDNNSHSAEGDAFLSENIARLSEADSGCMFLFYDQMWAHEVAALRQYRGRFLCVNGAEVVSDFSDKVWMYEQGYTFRDMIHRVVPGKNCGYDALCGLFGTQSAFVVQRPVSSGGDGTFLIDAAYGPDCLEADEPYLVGVYQPNSYGINLHAVIYDDGVLILPGSVQLVQRERNRLLYRGADYIAYSHIDAGVQAEFQRLAMEICTAMGERGYRGVCGIDGLVVGETVYITECNARFQASTSLLNRSLAENGLPSVQELTLSACSGGEKPDIHVTVRYSNYSFRSSDPKDHLSLMLRQSAADPQTVSVDFDGYSPSLARDADRYLFRICFSTNIVFFNPDGGLFYHENITGAGEFIRERILKKDKLAVKIALMCQGTRLPAETRQYLEENGGIRPGNNNAMDLETQDGLVFNAPIDVKFIEYTPFCLNLDEADELVLFYYDQRISNVRAFPVDPLSLKVTKAHGIPYESVAYLSTDRLRIHMTNSCIYKLRGQACTFCNIQMTEGVMPFEDIEEVVEDYLKNCGQLRHFLIGGQSAEEKSVKPRVAEIIRIVRRHTDKGIYVMSIPYSHASTKEMFDAGMTEIACNMEIYDERIAREIMPGKGRITREEYLDALSYAVSLMGAHGNVKSALIAGLEPYESFLRGIRALAEQGIEPIISVFRPLENTPLSHYMAPPLCDLYQLFWVCESICGEYGLKLGPSNCVKCQNNTLSLPDSIIEEVRNVL